MHATPDAKQPIAIVIPHEQNLRAALGGSDKPLADLCADKAVKQLVMKECNAAGKKNGFKTMEMLEAVILSADEWTPQSGLLTAAQKVQRKKVAEKFDAEIKVSSGDGFARSSRSSVSVLAGDIQEPVDACMTHNPRTLTKL